MIKRVFIRLILSSSFLLCLQDISTAGNAEPLLKKGWAALVKDNDTAAIACFERAYEIAVKENDLENKAAAQLNLGICYFGMSAVKGLAYCFASMADYKKLEKRDPQKALYGRCRCLQLISTVYSRQGKYNEAILLSREALQGFTEKDSNGYMGLAYASIGACYARLSSHDSAEYYQRKALHAQLVAGNFAYLPDAFVKVADIELKNGNKLKSHIFYTRSLFIADSSENKQAQVGALLGLGKWHLAFAKADSTEIYYLHAKQVAAGLNDKSFYLNALQQLLKLKKQQGSFLEALAYREEIAVTSDSMYSFDKNKLARSLEMQFNVAEKDRKLELLQKEKDITLLSNYLLWGTIAFIILIATGIILFLKRSNKRDKVLLQTKEALVNALEEQKKIREQYLQNELEYKESQLSAMALQMLQKNELMQDLRQQVEKDANIPKDYQFGKLISKGLNHDKEWADFNTYFESINKNFYSRLKNDYPDISPNDLKICALIKLNMSIKEMSGILNISPDSVKTARYRLRKKLQLNSEDNLTDFILKL